MTVICRGGTSTLNSGLPEVIVGTSAVIEAALVGASLGFLIPFSAILAIGTYDLLNSCASDPPGFQTMSDTELDVLAHLQILDPLWPTALSHLTSNILTALWLTYCHCTDGLPPTTGTPPTNPPNGPVLITPLGTECREFASPAISMGGAHATDLFGTGPDPFNITEVGYGETLVLMECWITPSGLNHPSGTFQMSFDLPGGGEIGPLIEPSGHATSGGPHVFFMETVTPQAGGLECRFSTDGSAPSTDIVQGIAHFYCNGSTPTNAPQPSSPTTPDVSSLLNQILTYVTLIQRQSVPFAYIPSTVHSGLTGSGELTLQGLLGVKVNPTTIPLYSGVISGDPDSLWLNSWIRWGNADGWIQREFLTSAPFLSFPELAGQFTRLGYTLEPGLVAEITFLVREP